MDNRQIGFRLEDDYPTNLIKIIKRLIKYKRLLAIVIIISLVISTIVAISLSNYYTCQIKLSPELMGNNENRNNLLNIARSFGVRLGGVSGSIGSEALYPTLYPDIINSVDFRTSLLVVPIIIDDNSDSIRIVSYFEYLGNEIKRPWWVQVPKFCLQWLSSISGNVEQLDTVVNPFRLNQKQIEVLAEIEKNIVCNVDKKTSVVTIAVTDQNPLICATIADTVKYRLQQFLTSYRTNKAKTEYEYYKRMCDDARERYQKALHHYSVYADANRDAISEIIRRNIADLENETQMEFDNYYQIMSQMQKAKDIIQEK